MPTWYRGDFHAHTNFSDGYYTPEELVAVARVEKLDFLSITDHNTIEAFLNGMNITSSDLAEFSPLVIPGVEVTLKEGHFNILGVEQYAAWMEPFYKKRAATFHDTPHTFTEIMDQSAGAGFLNSINHPLLEPWAWLDPLTDLRYLHCLEIWNDPSWPDNVRANPEAVAMWTRWLNAGYRITAIGGTDYHRPTPPPDQIKPAERLGLPSTYVYASELTGRAILTALRQRRAYVSMGPTLTFQARVEDQIYEIGADLGELPELITFTAAVSTPIESAGWAQLLKNGQVIIEGEFTSQNDTNLNYTDRPEPGQPAWYRLDVRGSQGEILAVTNPIFVGPRVTPTRWLYQDFLPESSLESSSGNN